MVQAASRESAVDTGKLGGRRLELLATVRRLLVLAEGTSKMSLRLNRARLNRNSHLSRHLTSLCLVRPFLSCILGRRRRSGLHDGGH